MTNPINPGELLLHVGVHKTGTTALQSALADARPELPALAVRYPGHSTYQHRAVLAGAGRTFGWHEDQPEDVSGEPWQDLVAEARFDGRTVISSEFFDDLDVDTARRMVDDLGGRDRVRVAITLRPIGAILPSAWQQRLKTGYAARYNQFLKQIFAEQRSGRAQRFWYRHDQVEQVRRWAGIVGADRTYAIIIPEGDRTAIFDAFEGLLDLPAGFLAQRTVAARNRSMTAAEAEFVRRVNGEVVEQMKWEDYLRTVRRGLILSMVEQRTPAPDEARITTPKWAAAEAGEYGRRFADGIRDSGVQIIGDPDALAVPPRTGKADPGPLPMDAAVAGAVALVRAGQTSEVQATAPPSRAEALRSLLRPRRFGKRPVQHDT